MHPVATAPILVGWIKAITGVATLADPDPPPREPFGTNTKGKDAISGRDHMDCGPLGDAAECEFETDAHFATYVLRNAAGELLPRGFRLIKGSGVIASLEEWGITVEHNLVVLDIDLKHQPALNWKKGQDEPTWQSKGTDAIWASIASVAKKMAGDGYHLNYVYRSQHGLRFIFVLAKSVPPSGYEPLLRRIIDSCHRAGLKPDEGCLDWTRFFRLPRVWKDKKIELPDGSVKFEKSVKTWEEGWFDELLLTDQLTTPREADLVPIAEQKLDIIPVMTTGWDAGEAMELAEKHKSEIRRAISDVEINRIIFDGAGWSTEGSRHTHLTKLVGIVVRAIVGYEWATPQIAWGTLIPATLQLGDDEDWVSKAKEMVSSYWSKDAARLKAHNDAVVAEVEEKAAETAPVPSTEGGTFFDAVRSWLPAVVTASDEDVAAYLKRHQLGVLVDQVAKRCHILRSDGFYEVWPCHPDRLPMKVRESGMDWLIPTELLVERKGQTSTMPLGPDGILRDSGRTFQQVCFSMRHNGSFVELIDGGCANFNLVPFRLRTDLKPLFTEACEMWLQRMVIQDRYHDFIRAVAYMIAINHGPTAAVALIGKRAAGKKMLAQALAECFTNEVTVPGDVLTARFNDPLLRGPIVWCDEGVADGDTDFADSFRRIVGGGTISVEPKGRSRVEVCGVHRVLITANNNKMISKLIGREARSRDDVMALGERLVQFSVQEAAAVFLAKNGGPAFTKGWIKGDDGTPSNYVLARHLLWHYQNTLKWNADGSIQRMGKRLLFEGIAEFDEDSLIAQAAAQAGLVPTVALAIDRLLNVKGAMRFGARIHSTKDASNLVAVTMQMVFDETKLQKQDWSQPFFDAIDSLTADKFRGAIDGRQGNWRLIDPKQLYFVVEQHGLPSPLLMDLAGVKRPGVPEGVSE